MVILVNKRVRIKKRTKNIADKKDNKGKIKKNEVKKTVKKDNKTSDDYSERTKKIDQILEEHDKNKAKLNQAKKEQKERKKREKEQIVKEKSKKKQEKKDKKRLKKLNKKTKKNKIEEDEKNQIKVDTTESKSQESNEELDKKNKTEVVKDSNIETIERKDGFGWNGLGTRLIIFDKKIKEYRYRIIEPSLNDEEEEIKEKLIHLFRVRANVDVFDMDYVSKTRHLKEALDDLILDNNIKVTDEIRDRIYYFIMQYFIGYGKIDILMHDEDIEDISCDGHGIPIFVYHKNLENIKSNVVFNSAEELNSFVVRLSQMCGKQISVYEPVVDGKLEDGSRLQTTLAKTITKESTFTIRRFREDPLTPIDLIENNTMSLEMAAYFWMIIEKGASVLFCGGTASGKTTMLNALSLFLPSAYKIVSVEDTREINLPHENWIAGTTRTGFSSSEKDKTGKDIDMFDLIRVALRQRPRAIIVGEVRGKETYSLFQAMTTGHLSYSTVHASDMHTLIQRLESPPINLPRALLTSLDLVVFLNSLTVKGKPVRRVTNVTEIIKLDPETNRLVTITPYYWISEIEDRFESTGGSRILNKVKLENMWSDSRLETEIKNRMKVLKWMIKNHLRSYIQVGEIISDYHKDPKDVMKRVEDSK